FRALRDRALHPLRGAARATLGAHELAQAAGHGRSPLAPRGDGAQHPPDESDSASPLVFSGFGRGSHPDAGLRFPGTGLIFSAEPPAELLGTDSLDAVGHAVEFVWLGIGHGATGGPGPSAGPVADRAAARRGG